MRTHRVADTRGACPRLLAYALAAATLTPLGACAGFERARPKSPAVAAKPAVASAALVKAEKADLTTDHGVVLEAIRKSPRRARDREYDDVELRQRMDDMPAEQVAHLSALAALADLAHARALRAHVISRWAHVVAVARPELSGSLDPTLISLDETAIGFWNRDDVQTACLQSVRDVFEGRGLGTAHFLCTDNRLQLQIEQHMNELLPRLRAAQQDGETTGSVLELTVHARQQGAELAKALAANTANVPTRRELVVNALYADNTWAEARALAARDAKDEERSWLTEARNAWSGIARCEDSRLHHHDSAQPREAPCKRAAALVAGYVARAQSYAAEVAAARASNKALNAPSGERWDAPDPAAPDALLWSDRPARDGAQPSDAQRTLAQHRDQVPAPPDHPR